MTGRRVRASQRSRRPGTTNAALALLLVSVWLSGCGPDARLTFAEESVRVASSALAEASTSGGETPALEEPLARVSARLAETERAVDVWRDNSGALAYRTRAPCLRAALIALRDALLAASLPVPSDLDEADALLEEVGGNCRTLPATRPVDSPR